jgi:hypothetical protein
VVTSVLNRYYDPSTDQFLSIDPKVGITNQAYLFTGDDPLNGSDPIGDGGGAVAQRLVCFVFLSANCFGQFGQDYSELARTSEQDIIHAIQIEEDTEKLEPTLRKAIGEEEEVDIGEIEVGGEIAGNAAKDVGHFVVAQGRQAASFWSNVLSKALSGPHLKIGPIDFPLPDFGFAF